MIKNTFLIQNSPLCATNILCSTTSTNAHSTTTKQLMNQFSRCLSNVRTALNIIVHEEQREREEKKTHLSPPLSGQVIDFSAQHYAFSNHSGQNDVDIRGFNKADKSRLIE